MKKLFNFKAIKDVAKYNMIFTIIIIFITTILVFASPNVENITNITNQIQRVNSYFGNIDVFQFETISNYFNTVSSYLDDANLYLIGISVFIIIPTFIFFFIIHLILSLIVNSEYKANKKSIVKRIIAVLFSFIGIYFSFKLMMSGLYHTLVGLDAIYVIVLLLVILADIYILIGLLYTTIIKIINNEFEENLFLESVVKTVLIIGIFISVVTAVKDITFYLYLKNLVTSVDYYSLLQLDQIFSISFDFISDKLSSIINIPFDFDGQSPILSTGINSYIYDFAQNIVDRIYLDKVYAILSIVVLSIVSYASFTKTTKYVTNKIYALLYLVSTTILIILLILFNNILFASLFVIILLVLLLVHIYQYIVKYHIFTLKENEEEKINVEQYESENNE